MKKRRKDYCLVPKKWKNAMNNVMTDENGKLQRDYWNILKGIGAFCVVLGHCAMPVQNFVYLFHVPLFFFISGYMYNEQKYGDAPYDNLKGRMKSWVKYVALYIVYILLHNVFGYYDMLRIDEPLYTKAQMVEQMAYAVIGDGNELLAGPLWFVPVLVIGSAFMGFVIYYSRMLEDRFKSKKIKFLFQGIVIGCSSIVGYLMIAYGWDLPAHMQIAFAVQPYFWAGYLLRNYMSDLEKYIKYWVGIILFLLLAIYSRDHLYSLVDGYVSPIMYLTAFMGFYVCMCLAKGICVLQKSNYLRSLFVKMGQASFLLMGTHFMIIRGIDRIYAGYHQDISMMYEHYLGNHNMLIPLYLVLGIGLPLLLQAFWNRLSKGVAK